jgi:hypothetical protein
MRTGAVVVALAALTGCDDPDPNLTGDAAIDSAPVETPVDAAADAPTCVDPYEASTPYVTGVATTLSSITLTGAMICPAGDQDEFEVTIEPGRNLEMVVEAAASDPPVEGSLLNASRTPLINTAPMAGARQKRRAFVANLPAGTFYVATHAAPGVVSHYTVTITVTGP